MYGNQHDKKNTFWWKFRVVLLENCAILWLFLNKAILNTFFFFTVLPRKVIKHLQIEDKTTF